MGSRPEQIEDSPSSTPDLAPGKNNSGGVGGYDAYFGTYVLDRDAGKLVAELEGSISTSNIGSKFVRDVRVLDKRLRQMAPRRAAFDDKVLEAPLGTLINKVAAHPTRITDEDIGAAEPPPTEVGGFCARRLSRLGPSAP